MLAILLPIGEPLVAPKKNKVAVVASRAEREELAGYQILCVRLNPDGSEDRLASDIAMKVYRDNPEVPFIAIVISTGAYELRSDKHGTDFDVSAIARMFGGGGHRNAAGFSLIKSKLEEFENG
ncbi:MAG: DHHA1 domain-containing protein [Desertifilum sp.]|nr:DHHA1 domain-containing protein [Desertifilum sp.]